MKDGSLKRDRVNALANWLRTPWQRLGGGSPLWKAILAVAIVSLLTELLVSFEGIAGAASLECMILSILLGIALLSVALTVTLGSQTWGDIIANIGTELVGAVLTYVLLQMVVGGAATKEELIAQMGSEVNEVAVPAVEELRRKGWLTDGSLQGADLWVANLREANLYEADLREADLGAANLRQAYLMIADLREADLGSADLQEADLAGANLQEATLWVANLQGASLGAANLRKANLERANLRGAMLGSVNLREANLESADLCEAELIGADLRNADVNAEQLAQASYLALAILPDGTALSEDNWEAEFEDWLTRQKELEDTEESSP